jgi:N-acetylneuraminate synthase
MTTQAPDFVDPIARAPVEIVAEIGSSHHGLMAWASELVAIAKHAGATAAKVQYFGDPEALATQRGLGPEYAAAYRRFNMPLGWLPTLADQAHRHGLRFMVTAFQPADCARVLDAGADDLKISSFEADDPIIIDAAVAALRASVRSDQRLIVSCGRGIDPHLIRAAVALVDARVLHCVSAYPVGIDELNLDRIRTEQFDGYSDHSHPELSQVGAIAVALGAQLLEVHLRLDATPSDNPDFPHSRSPGQFARYVAAVRLAERMLGSGANRPMPCEAPFLRRA